MSSEPYTYIEQDHIAPNDATDDLPTYDDLAAQNGPNSRFGRWRGWIEKRAAERYIDISPEERTRRRERGWGNEEMDERNAGRSQADSGNRTIPTLSGLHIQTSDLHTPSPLPDLHTPSPPLPPLPFLSQRLPPSHLKINQFGSRFLPHSTSPIRCLLPLESGRLLLIGHDEGLSVLDMFPQEWSEDGRINVKGPDEAHSRLIWHGESVYQMSLLEAENTGDGIPQGVVLVLVGPEPDAPGSKDADSLRALRMYNLASLTSLAKWAVAQKGARPLDLHRPPNWQAQQSPNKRNRPQSIARSLKSLIDVPGGSHSQEPTNPPFERLLSPYPSITPNNNSDRKVPFARLSPNRKESDDSSWDVVEDLPLRWATDYVPLATAGSRLLNTSIISYSLWSDENRKGRGGQLLAIAAKNNILLYETPRGERAFRFVKEFYTPLQPRSITFFQQDVNRSSMDTSSPGRFQSHKRSESSSTMRAVSDSSRPSSSQPTLNYGTHLSLFVIFDKKAGWIRLVDSAVGEMDLYEIGGVHQQQRSGESLNTSSILRGRMSLDANPNPKWIPPVRCKLPTPQDPTLTIEVNLVTRGKQTHVLPSPLPTGSSSSGPALSIVTWRSTPTSISARVCASGSSGGRRQQSPTYLQLVAFGEDGVEVQELSLSFLGKGKGKARVEEPIRAEEDLGGDSGFLCTGGHWDQTHHIFHRQLLSRSYSATSTMSTNSFNSLESEELMEKMKREEGIYGWCRKGAQDWRVFWVGGSLRPDDGDDEDSNS